MTDGTTVRVPTARTHTRSAGANWSRLPISMPKTPASRCATFAVTAWTTLKRLEKDGEISQDDSRDKADDVQKQTDQTLVTVIDSLLDEKEKEIMQV